MAVDHVSETQELIPTLAWIILAIVSFGWFSRDVTAAMLVHRTIEKESLLGI